jgi:hypothetical protein
MVAKAFHSKDQVRHPFRNNQRDPRSYRKTESSDRERYDRVWQ